MASDARTAGELRGRRQEPGETWPAAGRSYSATFEGERRRVATTGDRRSDYIATSEPTDSGRGLLVTCTITTSPPSARDRAQRVSADVGAARVELRERQRYVPRLVASRRTPVPDAPAPWPGLQTNPAPADARQATGGR